MSTWRVWPTAWARAAGLGGCLLLACVNRGMQAPDPGIGDDAALYHPPLADAADATAAIDGTADGTQDRSGQGGRSDGAIEAPGAGGMIGSGGRGAGGSTGTGGSGTGGVLGSGGSGTGGAGTGGGIADAGSPDRSPDGPPDSGQSCSARFNFEGGALYGAFINTGYQTAFSNLSNGTDTACGNGALRLNVSVTPAADKGEVIIPLGASEDLSGKTLSLAVKTTPAPGPNAYVMVFLVPGYTVAAYISPIPDSFATTTVTLPARGGRPTSDIAIQVLGRGDTYSGVITFDELDIR